MILFARNAEIRYVQVLRWCIHVWSSLLACVENLWRSVVCVRWKSVDDKWMWTTKKYALDMKWIRRWVSSFHSVSTPQHLRAKTSAFLEVILYLLLRNVVLENAIRKKDGRQKSHPVSQIIHLSWGSIYFCSERFPRSTLFASRPGQYSRPAVE